MKNKIAVICSLGTLAALILSSGTVLDSCKAALGLCAELIIPSLFPFFVVSIILNRLGLPGFLARVCTPAARFLFGVSGAGSSALIMGLMGGYPLGAAYIADMHESGAIDTAEAEQLLGFCNNSARFHNWRGGRGGILLGKGRALSLRCTYRRRDSYGNYNQKPQSDKLCGGACRALSPAVFTGTAGGCKAGRHINYKCMRVCGLLFRICGSTGCARHFFNACRAYCRPDRL